MLDEWILDWSDLVEFEIVPVVTSRTAAAPMDDRSGAEGAAGEPPFAVSEAMTLELCGGRFSSTLRARRPRWNEHDMEAIGVGQGDTVLLPVRVCRLDRLGPDTFARLSDRVIAADVEDEERFGVRFGRSVRAAAGELEVRVRSRDGEEHSVVALVVIEAADFWQAEAVAVEVDEFVQTARMSCDPKLQAIPLLADTAWKRFGWFGPPHSPPVADAASAR
jgi:Domain of unknown function (DUF3303)